MHLPPSPGTGADPQVLVVDDNPVNQQVAVGLLRRLGVTSAVAADGLAAIDMLRVRRFALVLMDLQMPGLDGVTATRRIRSGDAGVLDPSVPVLALTANAFPDYRRQCLEAGFDDFLTKPVDARLFAETLRRWLPSDSAAPPPPPADEPSRGAERAAAAIPPVDQAAFDRAGLLERSMDDPDLAREILEAFLTEAGALYASLERELQLGDASQARASAHSIKGAAANAGALRITQLAAAIEARARSGDVAAAVPLAEELGGAIDAFRRCVSEEFAIGGTAGDASVHEAAR